MPWLPLYINTEDSKILLALLNDDEDIAFIVSDGKKKWKAVERIESLEHGKRYCLWHVPSGPLPLAKAAMIYSTVKDPWKGWKEKRTGADPTQPFFGPGHPGVIWLDLLACSLREPEKIGLSSFEWIGDHYKSSGNPAPEITKKWWGALRKSITKMSVKIPRVDDADSKNEIYTFPGAAEEIKNGRGRAENPNVIDYS